jgi:formylglycine-generating enzyme required for sulfatase activity
MKIFRTTLTALTLGIAFLGFVKAAEPPALNDAGRQLEAKYAGLRDQLRTELASKLPDAAQADHVNAFLASGDLDAGLAKFVVLHEATPERLAMFAQQGAAQAAQVERMLADADLMKRMLVADGADGGQYGRAMEIYTSILEAGEGASSGVLERLALAIGLEHAVPVRQENPPALTDAPDTIDPVKRYLHFEKAYLAGELDPAFENLDVWHLRMVVNGNEPDETLTWGREMLRNFRPDHIYTPNHGWRYSGLVGSDVRYGSGDVKHDRPELQRYQNILMNGGVCGRRAFIGRFILRAHGIPTIAKPSRGHGALARWTPDGWVVNLGPNWGGGWTGTRYRNDHDFLATTQARPHREAFLKVKRAQWAGDVAGEPRMYGENDRGTPGFWYNLSFRTQREIIEGFGTKTLAALGEELGESDVPLSVAEELLASDVKEADTQITYGSDGTITIPSAAFSKPAGSTRDVLVMRSFAGGKQIYLPRFARQGLTILRGGTWKDDVDRCSSGARLLSGGYGRYDDWGLRAAVTPAGTASPAELTLDLGDGVQMELVYIKPGTFIMGGERTSDGRFECVEVPKHEVTLTKGFYLGKYEVTQAQYEAIMGENPSRSVKSPDHPVDNVSEPEAREFCEKLAEKTGQAARLPTEAEWEYAARAGTDTKWFFGEDPSALGDYAWFKDNSGAKSNPVGQKKPNPWGLYDMYGNVYERISDTYDRNYYDQGPKIDPTGPSQGESSRFEYEITVPRGGAYLLTAEVVTANYDQRLNVAVNDGEFPLVITMPFTLGKWQESESLTLVLNEGVNVLRFWRDGPPQQGMAIKSFTLKPSP